MESQISEIEAQAVFRSATAYEEAKAILCASKRSRYLLIVGPLLGSLPVLAFSGFEAPLGVKVLIISAFIASIISMLEMLSLRRRLEAAITILMQKNDGQV